MQPGDDERPLSDWLPKPRRCVIYQIRNRTNDKVYIGQSRHFHRRMAYHLSHDFKGCGASMCRDLRAHGVGVWFVSVLEDFSQDVTPEHLDDAERRWMARTDPARLYNVESPHRPRSPKPHVPSGPTGERQVRARLKEILGRDVVFVKNPCGVARIEGSHFRMLARGDTWEELLDNIRTLDRPI